MKLKKSTKKKIQGSITVLLVIILLPMMTFSSVIVDVSRVNMARQMVSSAGDLAMNTALANYDTILKDVYGLFAMSQQEGMDNEGLSTLLTKYFAQTISSYGVVSESDSEDYVKKLIGDFDKILNGGKVETTNFLEFSNINVSAEKVPGSSLANASVMRKQIVEYMKYRAPLGVGMSFLESLTAFKKMDAQNDVIEAQVAAQQSTQDVTKACQTLITLIREYDTLVTATNTSLKGLTGSTDTASIPLEDYDTHVMKYLSSWNENYKHINKLNLVFLANSPDASSKYLKNLNYNTKEDFIKFDGTIAHLDKSGISVSVENTANTADALARVNTQIATLNSTYMPIAQKYTASILRSDLLTMTKVGMDGAYFEKANEDAAINAFIAFEKFLVNKADSGKPNYSDIATLLEEVVKLRKFADDYENKMAAEISAATVQRDAAKGVVDGLKDTMKSASSAMSQRVANVKSRIKTFLGENTVDIAIAFLGETNKSWKPTISGALDGDNVESSLSNSSYIYKDAFSKLVYDCVFTGELETEVIKETKVYLDQYGYDKNGYDSYMKDILTDEEKDTDLFKLLTCLKTCHAYDITYKNKRNEYNNANSQLPAAEADYSAKAQTVVRLNGELESSRNSVNGCIQQFHDCTNRYQADLFYYEYYKVAGENTISGEASKIKTHFSQLKNNVKALKEKLEKIDAQIETVKNAIKEYNKKLDSWDGAKTTYETNNGDDSFSNQTTDDIKKARNEYDDTLYDTLDLFVISMWNEFDDFYSKLTDANNFKYGSLRIDAIETVQHLKNAISSQTFDEIITVEKADAMLSTLYVASIEEYNPYTMDYTDPKQLCFLSPNVLQIQALKHLNSAYKEESELTKEDMANKAEYETAKNQLTGKTTTETEDSKKETKAAKEGEEKEPVSTTDKVNGNFGYTFKDLTASGSLPSTSGGATAKADVEDSDYKLDEKDDKLDASTSVGKQSDKTSGILEGIADIATTAVENLYILNYIFENFSYNTIVQDRVIKDNPLNNTTVSGQIVEAQTLFSKADTLKASKNKITTLSNFKINEYNNYLYGAEIEYILFGNKNASTNVTSVKASIYALRFAFNCIFAFTNSEIRNSTMAAGLAVQAATCGIVPYQVVQIVLQLALAAAESAIDLSAMNHGLSVAIIKTKDTWTLSASGGAAILKDAANAAANAAIDKATSLAQEGIGKVTSGLNNLVDAGADELKTVIGDIEGNMNTAAEGVLESILDNITSNVMAEIEYALNELQCVKVGDSTVGELKDRLPTKAEVKAKAEELFGNINSKLDSMVTEACGGNAMALELAGVFKSSMQGMINGMKDEVIAVINTASDGDSADGKPGDVTSIVSGKLNELKRTLIEKANVSVGSLTTVVADKAKSFVDTNKTQLQEYINKCGDDLSEKAAEEIKKGVQGLTDNFINTTLKVNTTSATSDIKSSPVSMFKFGYKDYLMLLTYISICANGNNVLLRTADVIQLNLQKAGEKAEFQHKANVKADKENGVAGSSFLMSNAYTYISVTASADLNMFFMDFDIFADQVKDDETESGGEGETEAPETEEESGVKINYTGILGY